MHPYTTTGTRRRRPKTTGWAFDWSFRGSKALQSIHRAWSCHNAMSGDSAVNIDNGTSDSLKRNSIILNLTLNKLHGLWQSSGMLLHSWFFWQIVLRVMAPSRNSKPTSQVIVTTVVTILSLVLMEAWCKFGIGKHCSAVKMDVIWLNYSSYCY